MQRKLTASFVLFTFVVNLILPYTSYAQSLSLPPAGTMVAASSAYSLPLLKGIKLDSKNPLGITFIIDAADQALVSKEDAGLLIRYFLAGLTIPAKDLWVNLSPYEQNRIIPQGLSDTDLGEDMLAQDYLLKQLSASLTYPETPSGKAYWGLESGEAKGDRRGSLSKVWIMPKTAKVYEHKDTALIAQADLKVMMDEDNPSFKTNILPFIEKDVNSGKNFAQVRQIYSALVLATWFKKKFQDSFYKNYINQKKVAGIDLNDKSAKDKIYALYCEAFKKGVYDYTGTTRSAQKITHRHYFSGGVRATELEAVENSTVVTGAQAQALMPARGVEVETAPAGAGNDQDKIKVYDIGGKDQWEPVSDEPATSDAIANPEHVPAQAPAKASDPYFESLLQSANPSLSIWAYKALSKFGPRSGRGPISAIAVLAGFIGGGIAGYATLHYSLPYLCPELTIYDSAQFNNIRMAGPKVFVPFLGAGIAFLGGIAALAYAGEYVDGLQNRLSARLYDALTSRLKRYILKKYVLPGHLKEEELSVFRKHIADSVKDRNKRLSLDGLLDTLPADAVAMRQAVQDLWAHMVAIELMDASEIDINPICERNRLNPDEQVALALLQSPGRGIGQKLVGMIADVALPGRVKVLLEQGDADTIVGIVSKDDSKRGLVTGVCQQVLDDPENHGEPAGKNMAADTAYAVLQRLSSEGGASSASRAVGGIDTRDIKVEVSSSSIPVEMPGIGPKFFDSYRLKIVKIKTLG